MTRQVGGWTVEVSGPYPCWVRLTYQDMQIHGIHHKDLRDLEYCIQRALVDIRDRLPSKDKPEVDREV